MSRVVTVEKAFGASSVYVEPSSHLLEATPDGLSDDNFGPGDVVRITAIDPLPVAAPQGPAGAAAAGVGVVVLPESAAARVSEVREHGGAALATDDGVYAVRYITQRRETCQQLYRAVETGGAFLLRATPQSGKTGLAQLFTDFLRDEGRLQPPALIVRLMLSAHWGGESKVMGQIAQASSDLVTLETLLCPPGDRQIVVIVDEGQIAYCHPKDPFWGAVKRMNASPHLYRRLCIIILASYGESTEGIVAAAAGTPTEFAELIADFNRVCSDCKLQLCIQPPVATVLKEYAGRHAGLTALLLQHIERHFCKWQRPVTDTEIVAFLYRGSTLDTLESRALIPVKGEKCDTLKQILLSPSRLVKNFDQSKYVPLVQDGIVFSDKGRFVFSSPLVEKHYVTSLLSGIPPATPTTIADPTDKEEFRQFILKVLEQMRSSVFVNCLSRSTMEFYLSLARLLPSPYLVHPDFPAANEEQCGYVDFYINGYLKWAVELLREGNLQTREAHAERFVSGAYSLLQANQRLVIDFLV
eukprot:m51a1_g3679 hypothetical protein (527) ;mRNA; r:309005-311065